MSRVLVLVSAIVFVVAVASHPVTGQTSASSPVAQDVARGRYVVDIAGCTDCHTAGYAESGGKAEDIARLKGDTLGHRGPWGTTYATNLRLSIGQLSEDAWVRRAKTLMTRPPMPWFNIRAMNEADLRAMYKYIKSLPGDAGGPAPAFLPPGQQPKPSFVQYPGAN
jgi:mono/diheme cytochrome c family protein